MIANPICGASEMVDRAVTRRRSVPADSVELVHAESHNKPDLDELRMRFWLACDRATEIPEGDAGPIRAQGDDASPTLLFDSKFYLGQLPWFLRGKVDAINHYLSEGWTMRLSPHPAFDSDHVAAQLGVREWTEPPLLGFLEHKGNVSAHPLFDVEIYTRHVPLDCKRFAKSFEAFLEWSPGARAPFSRFFSLDWYSTWEPVTRSGRMNPLLHYLTTQPARRRDPNPMVHNVWYDLQYPAKAGQAADPLIRFVKVGLREGHLPNPFAARQLKLVGSDSVAPYDVVQRYVDVSDTDRRPGVITRAQESTLRSMARMGEPEFGASAPPSPGHVLSPVRVTEAAE